MSRTLIAVQGTLKPGGTILLDEEPPVTMGRLTVILDPAPQEPPPPRKSTWDVLERIWAQNRAKGRVPPTAEEIDAEINTMRDEWEQRMEQIKRLQEHCARARKAREA